MSDVFDALGVPARRCIMDALVERDDQTQFEIVARVLAKSSISLTRQAVAQHLAVLESAGLVTIRKQGRCQLHTANLEPLLEAFKRWERTDSGEK